MGSGGYPAPMATTFHLRVWTRFFAAPEQVAGRFAAIPTHALCSRWEHSHSVEPGPSGTRYIDVVTFTPKVLPKMTGLFMERWFRNRHRSAAKGLEVDPQVTGVSVLRVLVEEEAK